MYNLLYLVYNLMFLKFSNELLIYRVYSYNYPRVQFHFHKEYKLYNVMYKS